jgi:uncharacterized protein YjbI with pentapeptide repeats
MMMEAKSIGNKIYQARKKLGHSQAQLAEAVHVSQQAVGKWERGESIPDLIMLNRLCSILGVDLNHFGNSPDSAISSSTAEVITQLDNNPMPIARPRQRGWDMSRGNWVEADFSGLKALHEKFSGTNLQRCKFVGSDLSNLLLKGNNIDRCDFSRCDFSQSQVLDSNLTGNSFQACRLHATTFSGSFVGGSDFAGADFTGAIFRAGGMEKCILEHAIWNGSTFSLSYLADLVFAGSLQDCAFENCTFKRVTFQNATLRNTFFKNRSLKHVKFIDCVADRLTYEFLKAAKANLGGVRLLESD